MEQHFFNDTMFHWMIHSLHNCDEAPSYLPWKFNTTFWLIQQRKQQMNNS